ncbi:DUF2599 domain-containing protein [Isoptericola sp. NPDC057391]|uniref:DUF2599 domain-containing protein n=1 Tax=Isoptericola sp. NPDC057391 TaxID=3346117 RepID=UPI0036287FED
MPARLRSRALPALAALALLGSCTPSTPAPTRSAGASATPRDEAGQVETLRVEVAAGEVTLEVAVPGATPDDPRVHVATDPRAGTATVSLDLAADAPATGGDDPAGSPTITLTSGGTLEPRADGSVTVRAGGAAVGGLSAPRGARLVAVDGTHLVVRPGSDEAQDGGSTTTLGTSAVASTDWGDREGGRSLAVVPTDWARQAGRAGTDLVWAELVASDPEVDTATMHDQLVCHAVGAPDKDAWNLEPWRPDVGLVATMAARCNPG